MVHGFRDKIKDARDGAPTRGHGIRWEKGIAFSLRILTSYLLLMSRPNFYDYLKIIAIITMILDHMGYFLYPDIIELRMIGRFAFPLFFLLIGWNQSSKVWLSLIIAAIVIQGSLWYLSRFHEYDLRQLNILPAAIIVKLLMGSGISTRNWITHKAKQITGLRIDASSLGMGTTALESVGKNVPGANALSQKLRIYVSKTVWLVLLTWMIAVCLIIIPRTKDYIEYGSMTLGMALMGLILRKYTSRRFVIWIPIILSLYGLKKINIDFPFDQNQRTIVYILWILWIISVRAMSYRNSSLRFNLIWDKLILLLSKYAVWVYVIHFLILLGIRVVR